MNARRRLQAVYGPRSLTPRGNTKDAVRRPDSLIFASRRDARPRHGAFAVLAQAQRSRPVQRQSVDVGSELVLVVEHLVARDDLARVGGHAAHGGDQTGFGAAPDLVVGLILANRSQEVVPLQLIGIGLLAG